MKAKKWPEEGSDIYKHRSNLLISTSFDRIVDTASRSHPGDTGSYPHIAQWAKAITSTQINSNHHKVIIMPCIVVRLNIRECCSTIKMYQSLLKLIKMDQKLLEPVK